MKGGMGMNPFLWEWGGYLSSLFCSSVSTFIYVVKIVTLILESGSILEILLLISVGGKNMLHSLYLFQKTKSWFFWFFFLPK